MKELNGLSARAGKALFAAKRTLATAESCTGGMLSHILTNTPGSSDYFAGGIIAYSNDVKIKLLGVSAETIRKHGAVSAKTAREMAEGIRKVLKTDIGIAITGIAGPAGGTPQKPVGLVFIAVSGAKKTTSLQSNLAGSRLKIKAAACRAALEFLLEWLSDENAELIASDSV